jgi:hypothetical protein
MKEHWKKIIAPIIVVISVVLVNIRIELALFKAGLPKAIIVIGSILPIIISAILIFVLVERIREVGKGEEDDLSNY